MSPLETVPNVSEGRRRDVIEEIGAALGRPAGVRLIDVSSDVDHHRTVLTAVGEAAGLEEGLLVMAETTLRRLDLRRHRGAHPRLGVVDVVPVVPLGSAPLDAAVATALSVASRVGGELGLPVYLYGHASAPPGRRPADLRRIGLEGLAKGASDGSLLPDFGPRDIDPRCGVTLVGARHPMVAFNAILATADLSIARAIARCVRESSGGLEGVQALGLALASRSLAQVSMNVFAPFATTLHQIVERVELEAARRGTAVHAVEVVGLVPAAALRTASGATQLLAGIAAEQILENAIAPP